MNQQAINKQLSECLKEIAKLKRQLQIVSEINNVLVPKFRKLSLQQVSCISV